MTNEAKLLNQIVDAWEVLRGGQQSVSAVEQWLIKDMAPVINAARKMLGRKKPS